MATTIQHSGISEEKKATLDQAMSLSSRRQYVVDEEVLRRGLRKLGKAVQRHPNRELRDSLEMLQGIFGD